MSKMEINGFLVEKFNQYGLNENAKLSTCPLCSENRKKKSDKCASVHWDSGLGVCHHCGESFQLHTYKKKAEVKEYKRPELKNNTELSDRALKWLNDRNISQFTIRRMRIYSDKVFMPQYNKEVEVICFPYFCNEELINIKYRTF